MEELEQEPSCLWSSPQIGCEAEAAGGSTVLSGQQSGTHQIQRDVVTKASSPNRGVRVGVCD